MKQSHVLIQKNLHKPGINPANSKGTQQQTYVSLIIFLSVFPRKNRGFHHAPVPRPRRQPTWHLPTTARAGPAVGKASLNCHLYHSIPQRCSGFLEGILIWLEFQDCCLFPCSPWIESRKPLPACLWQSFPRGIPRAEIEDAVFHNKNPAAINYSSMKFLNIKQHASWRLNRFSQRSACVV